MNQPEVIGVQVGGESVVSKSGGAVSWISLEAMQRREAAAWQLVGQRALHTGRRGQAGREREGGRGGEREREAGAHRAGHHSGEEPAEGAPRGVEHVQRPEGAAALLRPEHVRGDGLGRSGRSGRINGVGIASAHDQHWMKASERERQGEAGRAREREREGERKAREAIQRARERGASEQGKGAGGGRPRLNDGERDAEADAVEQPRDEQRARGGRDLPGQGGARAVFSAAYGQYGSTEGKEAAIWACGAGPRRQRWRGPR
jgi:hypothetical protein